MVNESNKHIQIRYHITRDSVESGATKLVRVDSKENTADLLTKPLPEEGHTRLRARLLGTTA